MRPCFSVLFPVFSSSASTDAPSQRPQNNLQLFSQFAITYISFAKAFCTSKFYILRVCVYVCGSEGNFVEFLLSLPHLHGFRGSSSDFQVFKACLHLLNRLPGSFPVSHCFSRFLRLKLHRHPVSSSPPGVSRRPSDMPIHEPRSVHTC